MATKKISKTVPKADKPKVEKPAEKVEAEAPPVATPEQILHIANVTATGYGLGPDNAVVVHRESKIPQPGATTMALAQTIADTHIIIPMRTFSEAQYTTADIKEILESDKG
jgi:hypothetical protein